MSFTTTLFKLLQLRATTVVIDGYEIETIQDYGMDAHKAPILRCECDEDHDWYFTDQQVLVSSGTCTVTTASGAWNSGMEPHSATIEVTVSRPLQEGDLSGLETCEVLPGATREELRSVMMQDVVGDYDTPDQVPEWAWVEQNASFSHVNNGHDGIWEFVLNLSRTFKDVPDRLKPILEAARTDHLAYLIFHQGT